MRNPDLDKILPGDEKIGELYYEKGQPIRIVDGKRIVQIDETNQRNIDLNLVINRDRL